MEGYAVVAYDFAVESSHPDCLFSIGESGAEKGLRILGDEASKMSRFERAGQYFKLMGAAMHKQLAKVPQLTFENVGITDLQDLDRMMGSKGQKFLESNLVKIIGEGPDMFKDIKLENLQEVAKEAAGLFNNEELQKFF